jgi:hypothetical protein
MEYPTFFTTEGNPNYQAGTLAADLVDFTTIHEFGHGYFYGILASNEFEEPMLDEGLNNYWNFRMLRERPLHMTAPLLRRLGIDFRWDGFAAERSTAPLQNPASRKLTSAAPAFLKIPKSTNITATTRTEKTRKNRDSLIIN